MTDVEDAFTLDEDEVSEEDKAYNRKRPTEVSWDSDDDLLKDDPFPTFGKKARHDFSDEELDEDVLLGISDNEEDVLNASGDDGQDIFDNFSKTEPVDGVDILLNEDISNLDGDVLDIGIDNTDILDEDVSTQVYDSEETFVDTTETQAVVPEIKEELPEQEVETELDDTLEDENQVLDDSLLESSESEGDDDDTRTRFKSERQDSAVVVSTSTAGRKRDIPDTLEVSAEVQASIDEFDQKLKQKKQRNHRGGYCNRQYQGNGRGMGMQQHRPMQLGLSQGPAGIQLQHRPIGMQQQRPQNSGSLQPKKIHINPHFKGTVNVRPDSALRWDRTSMSPSASQPSYPPSLLSESIRPSYQTSVPSVMQQHPSQPYQYRTTFNRPPMKETWGAPQSRHPGPPGSMYQPSYSPMSSHGRPPMSGPPRYSQPQQPPGYQNARPPYPGSRPPYPGARPPYPGARPPRQGGMPGPMTGPPPPPRHSGGYPYPRERQPFMGDSGLPQRMPHSEPIPSHITSGPRYQNSQGMKPNMGQQPQYRPAQPSQQYRQRSPHPTTSSQQHISLHQSLSPRQQSPSTSGYQQIQPRPILSQQPRQRLPTPYHLPQQPNIQQHPRMQQPRLQHSQQGQPRLHLPQTSQLRPPQPKVSIPRAPAPLMNLTPPAQIEKTAPQQQQPPKEEEPMDEETRIMKIKLDEQKKLREAIQKRKEERRQQMAIKRQAELKKKFMLEQGGGDASTQVAAVPVVEPVIQTVDKQQPMMQLQHETSEQQGQLQFQPGQSLQQGQQVSQVLQFSQQKLMPMQQKLQPGQRKVLLTKKAKLQQMKLQKQKPQKLQHQQNMQQQQALVQLGTPNQLQQPQPLMSLPGQGNSVVKVLTGGDELPQQIPTIGGSMPIKPLSQAKPFLMQSPRSSTAKAPIKRKIMMSSGNKQLKIHKVVKMQPKQQQPQPQPERKVVTNPKNGAPMSFRMVAIDGLPSNVGKDKLLEMLKSSGTVETLQIIPSQHKALARYLRQEHAEAFQKKYHRHMIELSHINVTLMQV